MNNLMFSLNATMPVFLVIVVGWVLRQIGMFNDVFCKTANTYVFKVSLPVLLFLDIAETDLRSDFNGTFVLYCMGVTTAMFLGIWALSALFLRDKSLVGAFAQGSVRGSAAVLGIAFVKNVYGDAGLTPLMIVAAVPLFNIFAVIILSFSARHVSGNKREQIGSALRNILKNPIIWGIVLGMAVSLSGVTIPLVPFKTLTSIAETATPIALLVVGAGFEGRKALAKMKPTVLATTIKLVILPLLSLPLAVLCGFHGAELIAILVMVGAPTTVTSYVMAVNMDNDGVLSSSIVVLSTLLSSVTLTVWIFLLKTLGML